MNIFNPKIIFFVLLILSICSFKINAQENDNLYIRGVIVKLNHNEALQRSNKLLGSILIENDENKSTKHNKTVVKITNESRIYTQADNNKDRPLKFDVIKLNQRVEIRFAPGPTLLTYPIQVSAAEIIILPDSAVSTSKLGNTLFKTDLPNLNSKITNVRIAIDAGNAVWVTAWAKGDATMLPDTFTADGSELVVGGKVFKGRKQILSLMRDYMQKRGGKAKLTVTTSDVWLDGVIAYETGTAVYEFTVDGQKQILERRYFTIWKRQSNPKVWKIYLNTGISKV